MPDLRPRLSNCLVTFEKKCMGFSSHSFSLHVVLQNGCESANIPAQCNNPKDFMILEFTSTDKFQFSAALKALKPDIFVEHADY